MPRIRFALIVNVFQMRRIQVICNWKSILNKEFQHCVESRSTEVRRTKMLQIRFALIVNLIQMRPIEVIRTGKSTINQEFQYHAELSLKLIAKKYESICDQQCQSVNVPEEQIAHFHFQLKLTRISHLERQNHR
jgi:hypothetical protein